MIAQGTQDRSCATRARSSCARRASSSSALEALDEVRTLHPEYVPTFLMAGQIAAQLGDAPACAQLAHEQGVAGRERRRATSTRAASCSPRSTGCGIARISVIRVRARGALR